MPRNYITFTSHYFKFSYFQSQNFFMHRAQYHIFAFHLQSPPIDIILSIVTHSYVVNNPFVCFLSKQKNPLVILPFLPPTPPTQMPAIVL